jgi:hypothetical protein
MIWNAGADNVPRMIQAVEVKKISEFMKHCESAKNLREQITSVDSFPLDNKLGMRLAPIKKEERPEQKAS